MMISSRPMPPLFWAIAALLILCPALVSCSHSEEERTTATKDKKEVTIAVSRTPLSSPFYIAAEKGYFAEEGLEVKFLDIFGGYKCLQAVLSGDAEMGTTSDVPIMFNGFKRDDFVVIATFVTSHNDVKIMTRRDSGIQAAADLAGKKVAVVEGSTSQFFLDFFLLMNGVEPETISSEGMGPEEMPRALHDKHVDAISVWEPFGFESLKLLGDQHKILPHGKLYRETFNLVVQRQFADKNQAVMEQVLRALDKAVTDIREDEKSSQQVVARKLGKDEEFIRWVWPDFKFGLKLDQELIITLEDEAKWALKKKLVAQADVPNYFRLIEMAPMKEVSPGGVTLVH